MIRIYPGMNDENLVSRFMQFTEPKAATFYGMTI